MKSEEIEGDGTEGTHALTMGKYGQGVVQEGERWVLLRQKGEGRGGGGGGGQVSNRQATAAGQKAGFPTVRRISSCSFLKTCSKKLHVVSYH